MELCESPASSPMWVKRILAFGSAGKDASWIGEELAIGATAVEVSGSAADPETWPSQPVRFARLITIITSISQVDIQVFVNRGVVFIFSVVLA